MEQEERKAPGARLERRKKRTREQIIKRRIIILAVVVAVLLLLLVLYRILVQKPEIPAIPTPTSGSSSAPDIAAEGRKKDFYTFMVLGRDTGGGGNTDTIMVASYDIPNQKLSVMSIPRDTMVNIPYDIKRINAVYDYAGGGEEGVAAVKQEVSQLIGFQPDYTIVIEWEAFGKLVDAIGGVECDVPRNMDYDDPTQDLHIHVKKGLQVLDGEAAMGVVRWRHNNDMTLGYASGDIGRIQTQQALMTAIIKQCLQFKNISKITTFARIFTEYVDTELTVNNLLYFGQEAVFDGLNMDNVNFLTMPGDVGGYAWSRTYQNNQSYVLPYAKETMEMVNEYLNPYVLDLTEKNLDIMSVNDDGSLSSSTGVVEDAKAAVPPVKPTGKPEPEPTESLPTEEPEPSASPEATEEPVPSESASPSESPEPSASPETSSSPEPSQDNTLPAVPSPVNQ